MFHRLYIMYSFFFLFILFITTCNCTKARTNHHRCFAMKPRHLLPHLFSRASLMSALCTFFSFLPKSHPSICNPVSPNPRSNFAPRATPNPEPSPDSPEERKSLAVKTGEAFLGLASFLIRDRADSNGRVGPVSGADALNGSGDKIGVKSVIWEQREEDVEAERERRKVTSPGFSFSAAGLLFPYHIGVARLLLERGYIKVYSFLVLVMV